MEAPKPNEDRTRKRCVAAPILSLAAALGLCGAAAGLEAGCSKESPPAPTAPSAPSPSPAARADAKAGGEGAAAAPTKATKPALATPRASAEALRAARDARRPDTQQFGDMAADTVLVTVDCGGRREVPTIVGVLDVPYDHAQGLIAVAEVAAEKALASTAAPEGCSIEEATYWARDEAGGGDWVVRYSTSPEAPTALWWVPDSGPARRVETSEVPARAFAARLLRGASYFAEVAEDTPRAMELLGRAVELAPDSPTVAEVRAELVTAFDPKRAAKDLRAFIEAHPDALTGPAGLDLKATLAAALLAAEPAPEERAEATRLVDEVLARDPTHAKALSERAEDWRAQGELDRAIEAYQALLTAHPDMTPARYNLATLLLDRDRREEAIAELDRYLDIFREDADALLLRGRAHLAAGRVDAASRDAKRLLALAPEAAPAQDFARAVEEAQKAGAP